MAEDVVTDSGGFGRRLIVFGVLLPLSPAASSADRVVANFLEGNKTFKHNFINRSIFGTESYQNF